MSRHNAKRDQWQRSILDDDLELLASIYLDSAEGQKELIENVTQLLWAYGFHVLQTSQAPGSFFFSMTLRFGTRDREPARRHKRKLTEALVNGDIPSDSTQEQRRAVKKVKTSLWSRAKRKLKSVLTIGNVLVLAGGLAAADIAKDEIKKLVEEALKDEGQKVVQKMDIVVTRELPPALAHAFHHAIQKMVPPYPP